MGIEAIGTIAGGVGSAMSRIGPSLGRIGGEGLSLGGLSSVGKIGSPTLEMGPSLISPIVNEGPVSDGFIGEIIFNPVPTFLKQAENVAAAAWKTTEPVSEIMPMASESIIPETFIEAFAPAHKSPVSHEVAMPIMPPKVEPSEEPELGIMAAVFHAQRNQVVPQVAGMIDLSQNMANNFKPDAKDAYQKSQILTQPMPQPLLAEETLKEEEVADENRTEEKSYTLEGQEIEILRLKHVEDSEVSEARKLEIREAIRKAKNEAEVDGSPEIEGWRIQKHASAYGRRSGILDEDDPDGLLLDGSRVESIEELAGRNYGSESEANAKSEALISEKPPVKRAKTGNRVDRQAVARVKKYIPFGKNGTTETALKIIKRRIERSSSTKNFQPITVRTEEVVERRIEDYPELAEVFPKAA